MRIQNGCSNAFVVATRLIFTVHAAAQSTTSRNTLDTWPYQSFTSEPDFQPPVLTIWKDETHCDLFNGLLFLSPAGNSMHQKGPLIMNHSDGSLVWNGPIGFNGFNFGVQTYKGEDVLVAWNGTTYREPVGRGNGFVLLWDKHYRLLHNVTLNDANLKVIPPYSERTSTAFLTIDGTFHDSNIDLHEAYITENGTLLVLGNNVTQTDCSSVRYASGEQGPKDCWVVDAHVYEIDIETNKVLFAWRSLDHLDQLPLSASVYTIGSEGFDGKTQSKAWGYFHHNAAEPFELYKDGEETGYIISSRYFSSAVAINRSGKVLWRIRGQDSSIDNALKTIVHTGEGADFRYQHDIRVVPDTLQYDSNGALKTLQIHMHDNHNAPTDKDITPTSGKTLHIDLVANTFSLVSQFRNGSGPIYATAQGSHQKLPNNNHFSGHGWIPVLEEFAPSGKILSTIQFGATPREGNAFYSSDPTNVTLSYRAYKHAWRGCPKSRPSVILKNNIEGKKGRSASKIFITWNGATEVEGWDVSGGIESEHHIQRVEKRGFETVVELVEPVEFVRVTPVLQEGAMRYCGYGSLRSVDSQLVFTDRVEFG